MIFDTLRLYHLGRLQSVPAPEWYEEARQLNERTHLDWHKAFDEVLGTEHMTLMDGPLAPTWIEVRCWFSSTQGIFVIIETPLEIIEQVLILDAADWLPFLTTYLMPITGVVAQAALVDKVNRLGNAVIAFSRHGSGDHVDAENGESLIDRRRRAERRKRAEVAHV
jgi:hypothetical protein